MRILRYTTIIALILVVSACGRRLPDEYFDTNTDFVAEVATSESEEVAQEPTAVPTEVVVAEEPTTETDVTSEEDTASEPTQVVEEAEPQFELVEVPPDPIIEQVANADPENGETLFGSGVACTSCHRVDSEDTLVGPGLLNIPVRAEDRIEDVVAERYLYTSISHPNDYVVDGFVEGVMPQSYVDTYTEQDLLDIVAYLMTLGDYPEREPVFMEVPVESASDDAEPVEEIDVEDPAPTEVVANEDEVQEDDSTPEVVVIVVTATPTASVDEVETSAEPTEISEVTGEEPLVSEPNFALNLSDVPSTINLLADRGSTELGQDLFDERLVAFGSCSTCHSVDGNPTSTQTDLAYIAQLDEAPSYIWAAIFSNELHPGFASEYEETLSGSDIAHLVAYLVSINQADD